MQFSAIDRYMSFFGAALTELIKTHFDGNQQRFSRATGIDPSMVSRQCSGRSLPDSNTIRKAISGIPPADAASLVASYLRDVCPPAVRDLVLIRTLSENDSGPRNVNLAHHLDISSLTKRDQDVARSVVKWLQVDPAAGDFLNHALGLVTRSTSERPVQL